MKFRQKGHMLKNAKHILIYGSLISLAGCANYRASALSSIRQDQAIHSSQDAEVTASWKVFDERDCQTYLGRDVIAEGYVPIQMTIKNTSNDPLYLNADQFNVRLPHPQEVAEKVHTSTATRVVAWGVGGLFLWPLLVPAVYDGIQSMKANRSLDEDYQSKSLTEHIIEPKTAFNGIVFVPQEQMNQPIEMFLLNERTQEKIAFSVVK
jgi:hypothetical protein